MKASLIQATLTNGVRVDETRLRSKQLDMLPRILELITQEETKLPVLTLEALPQINNQIPPEKKPTRR